MSFNFSATVGLGQVNPLAIPLTNGFVRSFAHVRMNLVGLDFAGGFTSIKRSRKRDREDVMSNNVDPVGVTLGENKYAASAMMLFDWWMNCIQVVSATYGPGYGDQPFTVYVSYGGAGLNTYTDTLIGCTISSTEADDSVGTKALAREVDLHPIKIYFGGFDDNADPLTGVPL